MLFKSDRDFFIFLVGFLFIVFIGTLKQWVEISTGLSLVTFSGIFIALLKYFNEKSKDTSREIINLVSFFRKEVLAAHESFAEVVRDEFKNQHYSFIRLSFSSPTMEDLLNKHKDKAAQQFEYLSKTQKIHSSVINLLNILEEFSLSVNLLSAAGRPEIRLIKHTFVTAVEDLITMLVHEREFSTGNRAFQNTIDLYLNWVKQIDKRSPEERFAEYGRRLKR